MTKQYTCRIKLTACIFALMAGPLMADYRIESFTIDAGGGTSTAGQQVLSGTVGQPETGLTMIGGSFAINGGFWAGNGVSSIIDCDGNGIADNVDFDSGFAFDCNNNSIPDACDLTTAPDCNEDGMPDECPIDGGLYWADDTNDLISRAEIDGTDPIDIVDATSVIRGIAVDPAGMVYWTSITDNSIWRANLNGTNAQQFLTGLNIPVGIELDLNSRKIYWTSNGNQLIGRANLDGTEIETVADNFTGSPSGVALDLIHGKVYWSMQGNAGIGRADLDGLNKETVVANNNAVEVAVDPIGGKIYWTTYGNDEIRRADLDGTNVETILAGQDLNAGIDLDLATGKLYWSTISPATIRRSNLDGTNVEDVVTGIGNTFRIDFVRPTTDCDGNNIPDTCDINTGLALDCNLNAIPDACDIESGALADCNANFVPDACEPLQFGDHTGDQRVNEMDLPALLECTSGPDLSPDVEPSSCNVLCLSAFDANNDGTVDLQDLAAYQRCYNGDGTADPACVN